MKKTPEQILKDFAIEVIKYPKTYNWSSALSELNDYCTLTDSELEELLPKKIKSHIYNTVSGKEFGLFPEEHQHNKTIDLTLEALKGRVRRELTRERFRNIMCEYVPDIAEDSQQPEWTQGELDKAYDALYDAQRKECEE